MKYLTAILLALLLLLCGCARDGDAAPGTSPTEDPDARYYVAELERLLAMPASPCAEHVISHRGAGQEEPEETFASYDLALAYGSRMLEQDLVISADGVLYCCHDRTPEALTGETRPFSELSAAEIDTLRTRIGQQRLLRLSDVFERYGTAVTYVIELRAGEEMERALLRLIGEYQMQEHIILQAEQLSILQRVEQVYPDIPKLMLCYTAEQFEQALEAEYVDIVNVGGGEFFNRESCERVHAAGKKYSVSTCNSKDTIRTCIEIGADFYFTDYTAKALLMEELYRQSDAP